MSYLRKSMFLSFICILLSFAETAVAQPPIQDMKNSVVRIVVALGREEGHGSGFAVGDGKSFVTNWHVVNAAAKGGSIRILTEEGRTVRLTIVAKQEEKDLAIVRTTEAFSRPPVKFLTHEDINQGQEVFAVGFPGISDLSGYSSEVTITKGILSGKQNLALATLLLTDAVINSGNSGGPLYDSQGRVVGVNTLKIVSKGVEGAGYAISANDIFPLLRQAGIEPNIAGNSFIDDILNYKYVLLAVVGVLAVMLLIVAKKWKRERKPTLHILGVNGYYKGKTIEIASFPCRLGRDPSQNNIVFPKDVSVVSRVHCSINFSGQNYTIQDESTNGIKLNGKQIAPRVPQILKNGDTFSFIGGNESFVAQIQLAASSKTYF